MLFVMFLMFWKSAHGWILLSCGVPSGGSATNGATMLSLSRYQKTNSLSNEFTNLRIKIYFLNNKINFLEKTYNKDHILVQ